MNLQRVSLGRNALFVSLFSASTALLGACGADASASQPHPAGRIASNTDPPPPRPQTKEECDACGGLWEVHGIAPAESCICRTSDGGKRCLDGRECEGQCLVDESVGFEVMNESDPPRGFFTGTCSTYDTTFGCHFIIPSGVEELLPLPADEAAKHLCID